MKETPVADERFETPYIEQVVTTAEVVRRYNPKFGDERTCRCGHSYYRHFDSYGGMYPIGCKYCECSTFAEAATEAK